MPETPVYGLPFEAPTDKPGITLTGVDSNDILAEEVEEVLQSFDARITTQETSGYKYLTTVVYTSNGIFTKGSYDGFKAVRVRVVGGGGQCGGVGATLAGQVAESGAAGGGGYSESFIVDSSLSASETVTIGVGGSSGAAGADGASGGTSSFGALLSATGGSGGTAMPGSAGNLSRAGGNGGTGAGGNILNLTGGTGSAGMAISALALRANTGGGSPLFAIAAVSSSSSTVGQVGPNYGNGGGGTRNGFSQAALAGAAGAPGVVIVDVFV